MSLTLVLFYLSPYGIDGHTVTVKSLSLVKDANPSKGGQVVARKKKESGSFAEMVRRGAEKLARDPRAQRTAKKGVSQLLQRLRRR